MHGLIPPPLSRSHREATLEEARQVKDTVDRFLAALDDELLVVGAGAPGVSTAARCSSRRRPS